MILGSAAGDELVHDAGGCPDIVVFSTLAQTGYLRQGDGCAGEAEDGRHARHFD